MQPTVRVSLRGRAPGVVLIFLASVVGTALVTWVLVKMLERKHEARTTFFALADVDEVSTDPRPWGINFPHHYEDYTRTAGDRFYGGSSALPESKLTQSPWLRRLYAGYAFSIDYREARGHAYMLYDQGVTERITKKPQAGACLKCHTDIFHPAVAVHGRGDDALLCVHCHTDVGHSHG
jgi:nitrite reductase (cytochrome c-552)